jgi:hypothetical protein
MILSSFRPIFYLSGVVKNRYNNLIIPGLHIFFNTRPVAVRFPKAA